MSKRIETAVAHKSFSDAYFHTHHRRAATSSNTYSQLVRQPEFLFPPRAVAPLEKRLDVLLAEIVADFSRWLLELQEGFNIILYGYGSKAELLTKFENLCAIHGDVFRVKGQLDITALLQQVEARLYGEKSRWLANEIISSRPGILPKCVRLRGFPLFIIIDSIEEISTPRDEEKAIFLRLAQLPDVHIITTMTRRDSMLSWIFASGNGMNRNRRKDPHCTNELQSAQGCNWIWHDVSTVQPYRAELEGRNLLLPPYANRRKQIKGTVTEGVLVSQIAADHILSSVTERARKLFMIIAKRQLQQAGEIMIEERNGKGDDVAHSGVSYSYAFMTAREAFLVSNDRQLKILLSEFTDHGLVRSINSHSDRNELLWISMSSESLQDIVKSTE